MDRSVAVVVVIVMGGLLAAQAPLNSQLGRVVGAFQATVVSNVVAVVLAVALAIVAGGGVSGVRRVGDVPLHVAIGGGLIGGAYVVSIVFTVRALGAGGLTAATIAGQLALAVVIDHFGWLGVDRSPLSLTRVAGIALLVAGMLLVVRK